MLQYLTVSELQRFNTSNVSEDLCVSLADTAELRIHQECMSTIIDALGPFTTEMNHRRYNSEFLVQEPFDIVCDPQYWHYIDLSRVYMLGTQDVADYLLQAARDEIWEDLTDYTESHQASEPVPGQFE